MPNHSKPKLPYYDFSKLLSYNAQYNFCIGGRGLGKTYGAKLRVLRDAIKSGIEDGDQFIYLRRYKTELQMSRSTFFADIQHEFPEWDFKVQGHNAVVSPVSSRDDKKRVWKTIGYFIPLVVAQNYKSVNFPRVKTIIFDEFIIEKGAIQYLPDEANVFNNFYSTVDRNTDKTKVFFLANAVRMTNPYFITYNINPNDTDKNGFIRMFDGFVIVHLVDKEDFKEAVMGTRFGKFIAGTEYADYAVGNQFVDNNDNLLGDKGPKATYQFTLEGRSGTFSVWYDRVTNVYYMQTKRPRTELMFTLIPERMDDQRTLMSFNDKPLQMLRSAFRHARTAFDKAATRNAFLEIFKR